MSLFDYHVGSPIVMKSEKNREKKGGVRKKV